ncbi:42673_t:CDS:1 [Gigaspora margarita]|uniref:42673_t:CDS:1 n=1 Tax=Gigaspora margarita TaxID=4874 RepID=A0ABM8W382_GIGMA|nr:42673_t:CDS:1 [Gigaspora margarita]
MASYLPLECLNNIFNCIHDNETLYSCLFVNRSWSNGVVPILWRKPFSRFRFSYRSNSKNGGLIIRTYLSCLPKSKRNQFCSESLQPFSSPLFFYPAFLKELDFEGLYDEISGWINTNNFNNSKNNLVDFKNFTRNKLNNYDQNKFTMFEAIIELIFKHCNYLDYIYFDVRRLPIVFTNILTKYCMLYNPMNDLSCFQRLTSLEYHGVGSNYTIPDSVSLDLLFSLSKVCQDLTYLKIRSFAAPTCDSLASLIQSQKGLQKLFLWELNLHDISCIIDAISSQAHSMREIEMFQCSFELCDSFEGLACCYRLNILSIIQCDYLTSYLLDSLANTHFPYIEKLELKDFNYSLIDLNHEDIPSEQVKNIIKNCSDNIQDLYTNLKLDDYFGIIETISTYCTLITSLELNTQRADQIPELLPILESCQKLEKLIIQPIQPMGYFPMYYDVSNEQLQWFATKLPSSVRHLEIRYWSINALDLEDFLSICGRNLYFMAWGYSDVRVEGDEKYFSQVILEFCKKASRKVKRIGTPQFFYSSRDRHKNNGSIFAEFY